MDEDEVSDELEEDSVEVVDEHCRCSLPLWSGKGALFAVLSTCLAADS